MEPYSVEFRCEVLAACDANVTPYFATTDKTGKFSMKNVPARDWEFQLWHESVGYFTPTAA
jgi:hypothetical protein